MRGAAQRDAALLEILFVTVCGTRALGRSPLKTRSPSPGLGSVPQLAHHAILHALVHTSPNNWARHAIRKHASRKRLTRGPNVGKGGHSAACGGGAFYKKKNKEARMKKHHKKKRHFAPRSPLPPRTYLMRGSQGQSKSSLESPSRINNFRAPPCESFPKTRPRRSSSSRAT